MKSKKYSYSKINTFNSCPLKYKFIYIDRIRKKDEAVEALLGKIIHQCLEWIYRCRVEKGRTYFSLDEIINKYRDLVKDCWHEDLRISKYSKYKKNDYLNSAMNWLVKYYNRYGPQFNQNVLDIEKKITFKIDMYKFEGIIDRIDQINLNTIKIIDYKTSSKSITEKSLKNNLQMAIYYHALQSITKEKNIILSHLYVRKSEEVSVCVFDKKEDGQVGITKENYLDDTKKNIINNIEKINLSEEKNNFIAKESNLCNWCYFWKECSKKSTNNPSRYLD